MKIGSAMCTQCQDVVPVVMKDTNLANLVTLVAGICLVIIHPIPPVGIVPQDSVELHYLFKVSNTKFFRSFISETIVAGTLFGIFEDAFDFETGPDDIAADE